MRIVLKRYRSESVLAARPLRRGHVIVANPSVPLFVLSAASAQRVRVHVVTAADKPRNHVFTVHGQSYREWPSTGSPQRVGS